MSRIETGADGVTPYTADPGAPAARGTGARVSRLPSLTGLRFWAALSVFFFHTSIPAWPVPPSGGIIPFAGPGIAHDYQRTFMHTGYIGVSFFFVLSGFLLSWSSRPEQRARAFWRRRMTKIFPSHLVMFGVVLILFSAAMATSVGKWLPNMLLVQAWFPQQGINTSVNGQSWTLCAELFFYLLFPLMIRPIRKLGEKALWAWAAGMIAATVAVQLITTYAIPDTPSLPGMSVSAKQLWFSYVFPPFRLFEFVLGALLARIVLAGHWPRLIGIRVSLVLLALGYWAGYHVPYQYNFVVVMIVPVGALIAAAAVSDASGRRTWLAGRTSVWLGNISFGFYLSQSVSIWYFSTRLHGHTYGAPGAVLVIVGFFTAAVLCGALLYHFVEDPAMRRFSRSREETAGLKERRTAGTQPDPLATR